MAQQRENWFIKLLKRNPFPRAFNRLAAKVAPPLDKLVMRLSGGRFSVLEPLSRLPVVEITCIGRKSGKERVVPLVYVTDPDQPERFAIIATNFGQKSFPAWYYNIQANPHVKGNIKGDEHQYVARELELDSEEYNYFWDLAVKTYFGYAEYKEATSHRTIPIFVLERVGG